MAGNKVKVHFGKMREVCLAPEDSFERYGVRYETSTGPYFYKDNGANILAVAHLDSVASSNHFSVVPEGKDDILVFNAQLDDRLGAYLITEYLHLLGLHYDILLTTGEETGKSSSRGFVLPEGKVYNWMFSFDRGGDDAVHYQYNEKEWKDALKESGFDKLAHGSYSDIASTEIGVCGINIGVGYYDYHSVNAYASMKEMLTNVKKLQSLYALYQQTRFPFVKKTYSYPPYSYNSPAYDSSRWGEYDDFGYGDVWTPEEWKKFREKRDRKGGSFHRLAAKTSDESKLFGRYNDDWPPYDGKPVEGDDDSEFIQQVQQAVNPVDVEIRCRVCRGFGDTEKDENCIFETDLCCDCYKGMFNVPWTPDWDEFDEELIDADLRRYEDGFMAGDEVNINLSDKYSKFETFAWADKRVGRFVRYSNNSKFGWVDVIHEGRSGKTTRKLLPTACLEFVDLSV